MPTPRPEPSPLHRRDERRAQWKESNREMIDALGGGRQAYRIVHALSAVGITSLEDMQAADAGTFTPPPDHHPRPFYVSLDLPGLTYQGDLASIRGLGRVAMKRIRTALDNMPPAPEQPTDESRLSP